MRLLGFIALLAVVPGCGSTLRQMCKQSCLREQDRCRSGSQGAVGTACDQDLGACLSRC